MRRLLLAACVVAVAAGPAAAARKKSGGGGRAPIWDEPDISTAAEYATFPNGAVSWGVHRPGPDATVAVVVRAGARQEDIGKNGVALAAARWVEAGFAAQERQDPRVTLEVEMHPGGAAFVMRGPSGALPGAVSRLLKAIARPPAGGGKHARVRASLDLRRGEFRAGLQDAIAAMCWGGSSFALATWGSDDVMEEVDDGFLSLFQRTWHTPRNMTLIAVGPDGARPYAGLLAGAGKKKMAREMLAPGEPGLPAHHVQGNPVPLTVAGASMPGPAFPGPALLARGRAEELLDEALASGALRGPFVVDIAWTKKTGILYAAMTHPEGAELDEKAQAQQLQVLENALSGAAELSFEDMNALRKREGSRLSRRFASPEGALSILVPLATVSDAPVDVRKEVMAAPQETMQKALDRLRDPNNRLTLRRSPRKDR